MLKFRPVDSSNLDVVELARLVPGLEVEHAELGPALQPRQGQAHVAVRGGAEPLVAVQPQQHQDIFRRGRASNLRNYNAMLQKLRASFVNVILQNL